MRLKDYLWKNNIIEKGTYMGVETYFKKEEILGISEIVVKNFSNYIIIKKQ